MQAQSKKKRDYEKVEKYEGTSAPATEEENSEENSEDEVAHTDEDTSIAPKKECGAGRVLEPRETDVLLGRGRPFHDFPGNMRMLSIVNKSKDEYHALPRDKKRAFAENLLEVILQQNTRFLRRCETETGEEYWESVDKQASFGKVWHALRAKPEGQEKKKKKNSKTGTEESSMPDADGTESVPRGLDGAVPLERLQELELIASDLSSILFNAAGAAQRLATGLRAIQSPVETTVPSTTTTDTRVIPPFSARTDASIPRTNMPSMSAFHADHQGQHALAQQDMHRRASLTSSSLLDRSQDLLAAMYPTRDVDVMGMGDPATTTHIGNDSSTPQAAIQPPPSQLSDDPRHSSLFESITSYARTLQAGELAGVAAQAVPTRLKNYEHSWDHDQ